MFQGRRLERLLGSVRFAVILAVFAIATSATMIGIAVLVDDVLELPGLHLMRECAVGFSGRFGVEGKVGVTVTLCIHLAL